MRLSGDNVKSRYYNGTIGEVVITCNGGKQVTVNLGKAYPQCYEWGNWYVTVTGKIQYRDADAFKLYNFVWSRNPSHLLLLGDRSSSIILSLDGLCRKHDQSIYRPSLLSAKRLGR